MSSSYSFTKSINDINALNVYVANTFPTVLSIHYDGITVIVDFSAPLTAANQIILSNLMNAFPNPIISTTGNTQSLLNATTTPLSANSVFTGSFEDISTYNSVNVIANTDQNGTLVVQFGLQAAQSDRILTYAVSGGTPLQISLTIYDRYMRLIYTNGTTNQTLMQMQTLFRTAPCVLANNISLSNNSSSLLAANATFTGGWEDVSRYSSCRVSALMSGTTGSLSLQFGYLSQQPDQTKTYLLTGRATSYVLLPGKWFRVVFVNSGVAQTTFQLVTFFSTGTDSLPSIQLSDTLLDQNDATINRSVIAARTDFQQYENLRLDEQNMLRVKLQSHAEKLPVTTSTPMFQIPFMFNIDTFATKQVLVASGTITWNAGRALINTAAAANSSATLNSMKYIRVNPGTTVTLLISGYFTTARTGSLQLLGAGTANNGLYFGYNGTTFSVAFRSNGVTTFIPQSNFNVDRVDGTGSSGINLNPTFGNVYMIKYDSFGFGNVSFWIQPPIYTGAMSISTSDYVCVHRLTFANSSTTIGLLNPQFPCTATAQNTTNTTVMTVAVTAMSVYSDTLLYRPMQTTSLDANTNVGSTAFVPIIILQNKATYQGQPNTTTVHIRYLHADNISQARAVVYQFIYNPTINLAPNYTDVNTTNSAVSYAINPVVTITAGSGTPLSSYILGYTEKTYNIIDDDILLFPGDFLCLAAKGNVATLTNILSVLTFSEF